MTKSQDAIRNLQAAAEKELEKAAEAGREQFANALRQGSEQMETAARATVQTAQRAFEQGVEVTKRQLDGLMKGYDEVAEVSRENINGCIAASSATAKAIEQVNGELLNLAKKSYDAQLSAMRAFAGVKTPKDFLDLQSELVKGRYEDLVQESNKIASVVSTAMAEILAPLNARFVDSFTSLARGVAR